MATYSISGAGTTGFPAGGANVRVISEVVDFSATTNAAADVFEVLGIPAETTVLGAGLAFVLELLVRAGAGVGALSS